MSDTDKIMQAIEGLTRKVGYNTMKLDTLVVKVDCIDHKVGKLEHRIAMLEGKMDTLEGRMDKLEAETADLKGIVVKMEHDHDKSLSALHDGFAMVYDIRLAIRKDIERINTHQELQDTRIMMLDA